jgi:Protein of unknown function (DUF1524)
MAGIYVAIFNPEHERWNAYPDTVRRAILALNLLNIKGVRPPMLAVASKFEPKQAAEAFRMFISWSVRFVITATTSRGSVDEALGEIAHEVFVGDISTASAIRKKVAGIVASDEEFRKAFEVATVSKAHFARYYLRSLEMAAKGEATPWFIPNDDRQAINLEHVLPENPGTNWPQFDSEAAKVYRKRIGNMALLIAKDNADIGNGKFSTKLKLYKGSPYELTRQIADVKEWGPSQIAERQKLMADLALKAWPL